MLQQHCVLQNSQRLCAPTSGCQMPTGAGMVVAGAGAGAEGGLREEWGMQGVMQGAGEGGTWWHKYTLRSCPLFLAQTLPNSQTYASKLL